MLLSAFSTTIGVARAINYVRERSRPAPWLRSWARRTYHAPGQQQLRVHHFLPGVLLSFVTGGAAILAHRNGAQLWLSAPFGTGAGLTLDEVGLLLKFDNPYWKGETLALVEGAAAAVGAVALAVRFNRRGATLLSQSGHHSSA